MKRSIHILHILQSQKPDPIEETDHTIRSRCACVWNFPGWNSHLFLHDSVFYFEIWAIFLFLFPFSQASGHGYFSSAFLSHSPYYFCNIMSHVKVMEYFLCGWEAYFCVTSSVEVSISIYGVYVTLTLKV